MALNTVLKVVLIVGGCAFTAAGLLLVLIIVDMFQHPRGVGMEVLAGPLVGIFALSLFAAAAACFFAARRLRKQEGGQKP